MFPRSKADQPYQIRGSIWQDAIWLFERAKGAGRARPRFRSAGRGSPLLPVAIDRIRKVLSKRPAVSPKQVPVFGVEVFGCKPDLEDLLGDESWEGSVPSTPSGARMTGEAITMTAMSVVAECLLQQAIQRREKVTQKSRAAGRPRREPYVSRR